MAVPKWAGTVTPLSKTLAMIIFITFPIIGFLFGMFYEGALLEKNQCKKISGQYIVAIKEDKFVPDTINAIRCSRLTLVNRDAKIHEIAFGEHDKHIPYGDFLEESLLPNERTSIKLTMTGTYKFHDHLHEEIKGILDVSP